MKKTSFLFLFCCMFLFASAQVRVGVKLGLSSTNLDTEGLRLLDQGAAERFELALDNSDLGVYGGFFINAQIGAFIIQPEFNYNSNSSDFELKDLSLSGFSEIRSEKYQYLDIPVLVGCKFGPLRLMAGPEGHVFLNSTSGLLDVDGYRQDFKGLTLGWQGGVGLDLWNLVVDIRYQGNFNNFGDHITFLGQQYEFNDSPSRVLFSLGWLFGG